jgi:ABC-type protease/lipase transport system fused ATPase/permease subunit
MILGPSGAGKSSLVRGILGIWPVATGAIRIDGAAAQDYDRADIGTQIGYLPQDIEILDGTISANIARFGEVDPESVVAAARDAGVHDFILSLPRGYDTEIGSDGGLLSPGQKQRIALARAIYRYPKLIVLDEPNSNLDEAGEAALNNTIRIMQERRSTILVVSHRQGVLPLADNLILVSSAQVIDFGKRQEVLARVQATQRPQRDGRPAETVSTAEPKPTITKPTEGPKAIPKSPVVWTGAKKAKDHDDKSD